MINSLKEFFNRLRAVMTDDFYIEENDSDNKSYLEKKYKRKLPLMHIIPIWADGRDSLDTPQRSPSDELKNSFQRED